MPRYINIELEQEKDKRFYQKAYTDYSMVKRYNKLKPSQLFDCILAADRPNDVIQHLYQTNNKDGWGEIDRLISFYRPGKTHHKIQLRFMAN